jgi:hypothetical protein
MQLEACALYEMLYPRLEAAGHRKGIYQVTIKPTQPLLKS